MPRMDPPRSSWINRRPGNAEVGDLHPALAVDDYVLRLDFAINNITYMCEAEVLENMHRDRNPCRVGLSGACLTIYCFKERPSRTSMAMKSGALRLAAVVYIEQYLGWFRRAPRARFAAETARMNCSSLAYLEERMLRATCRPRSLSLAEWATWPSRHLPSLLTTRISLRRIRPIKPSVSLRAHLDLRLPRRVPLSNSYHGPSF